MERTKKNIKEGQVEFLKLGKGTLTLYDGRIIQGGQRFFAYPEEISPAFRDSVELVSESKETKEIFQSDGVVKPTEPQFKIKLLSPGWYDVVNEDGKAINENKLRKPQAEALVEDLNQ